MQTEPPAAVIFYAYHSCW